MRGWSVTKVGSWTRWRSTTMSSRASHPTPFCLVNGNETAADFAAPRPRRQARRGPTRGAHARLPARRGVHKRLFRSVPLVGTVGRCNRLMFVTDAPAQHWGGAAVQTGSAPRAVIE